MKCAQYSGVVLKGMRMYTPHSITVFCDVISLESYRNFVVNVYYKGASCRRPRQHFLYTSTLNILLVQYGGWYTKKNTRYYLEWQKNSMGH